MGKCIGYGTRKGICPNCTEEKGSPVFCRHCAELRNEEIKRRNKHQKEAQKQTEKIIKERE